MSSKQYAGTLIGDGAFGCVYAPPPPMCEKTQIPPNIPTSVPNLQNGVQSLQRRTRDANGVADVQAHKHNWPRPTLLYICETPLRRQSIRHGQRPTKENFVSWPVFTSILASRSSAWALFCLRFSSYNKRSFHSIWNIMLHISLFIIVCKTSCNF